MKCPYCSHEETKVTDKRDSEDLSTIRRRRECLRCNKRFTTYEKVEMIDLVIVKKDSTRQRFDRNKLRNGILKACEKRPVSTDKIEEAIDKIEAELRRKNSTEIVSAIVGELVMRQLKRLDKVAYIRFASVYRDFQDIKTFAQEIRKLDPSKKR